MLWGDGARGCRSETVKQKSARSERRIFLTWATNSRRGRAHQHRCGRETFDRWQRSTPAREPRRSHFSFGKSVSSLLLTFACVFSTSNWYAKSTSSFWAERAALALRTGEQSGKSHLFRSRKTPVLLGRDQAWPDSRVVRRGAVRPATQSHWLICPKLPKYAGLSPAKAAKKRCNISSESITYLNGLGVRSL
jgi:hypothetical protein